MARQDVKERKRKMPGKDKKDDQGKRSIKKTRHCKVQGAGKNKEKSVTRVARPG